MKDCAISIIIPTLNEGENIFKLVSYLKSCVYHQNIEIIVSDGQSTDDTVLLARKGGAKAISSPIKGRAYQMNYGASIASAPVLYFLHADTFPPKTFISDISDAVNHGFPLGRYRTKFTSNSLLLKINAFFTRFDFNVCRGGDQTLFITKDLFQTIQGFNADMNIMEDYDLVNRARKLGKYKIFNNCALVSARKYQSNSWIKVQLVHLKIIKMFENGASQHDMVKKYNELITYR